MPHDGAARRAVHVPPGGGPAVWVVGDTYTFKAQSEDTDGAFTLFEGVIPPGAGPLPHVHHREDEAFYVLEGEIESLAGDRTFTAIAGSYVYIPRGVLHRFTNAGEATARMLLFFAPVGFDRFFIEVGQAAEPGGHGAVARAGGDRADAGARPGLFIFPSWPPLPGPADPNRLVTAGMAAESGVSPRTAATRFTLEHGMLR